MNLAVDDERILQYELPKTPAQILFEYCTMYHTSVEYRQEPSDGKLFKIAAVIGDQMAVVGQVKIDFHSVLFRELGTTRRRQNKGLHSCY